MAYPTEILLTREDLARLRSPSPSASTLRSLGVLASYSALAFAAIAVPKEGWGLVAAFSIAAVLGFILAGFLAAAHDCAHGSMWNSRLANRITGVIWAIPAAFNFTLYRHYHLEHHKYTSVEGDTEPSGAFKSVWAYLGSLPTLAFFFSFWKMSFESLFLDKHPHFIRGANERRASRTDAVIQLVWFVAIILALYAAPQVVLWGYLIPLAFYLPYVSITSLPEHYGCEVNDDPLTNTRTTHSNCLVRFFLWNANYHAEHHAYPSIPAHNLPELHRKIGSGFRHHESGFLSFHSRLLWELACGTHNPPGELQALTPSRRLELENE